MTAFSLIHDEPLKDADYGCDQIVKATYEVAGENVSFCVRIERPEACLSDIVPLAREMCDQICRVVQNTQANLNERISCRKGCSACCSYLVPLSIPEVLYLQDVLTLMKREDRSFLLEMCGTPAKKILSEYDPLRRQKLSTISQWYAGLDLPCPFLTDGICSIYEQRPLACREHMVTGSTSFCLDPRSVSGHVFKLPLSILEAVGQLAAQLEQTNIEAVMLPLAFFDSERYVSRSQRHWEAREMLETFLSILKLNASIPRAKPEMVNAI